MTVKEALKIVIATDNDEAPFMDYATRYAQAALDLGESKKCEVFETGNFGVVVRHKKTGKMMKGIALRRQLLYVLSNLDGWTGKIPKQVKETLRKASKEKIERNTNNEKSD